MFSIMLTIICTSLLYIIMLANILVLLNTCTIYGYVSNSANYMLANKTSNKIHYVIENNDALNMLFNMLLILK